MARTTLTPTVMNPQNAANLAALDLTALAAAGTAPSGTGTGNGVQFYNSPGQTWLVVSLGTTASTPTIAAGAISAAVTLNALTVSHISLLGPFYAAMYLSGTVQLVGVDFSSITNVLCAAVQMGSMFLSVHPHVAAKQNFELRIRFQMTTAQVARELTSVISANLAVLGADAEAELWSLVPPVRLSEEAQRESRAD